MVKITLNEKLRFRLMLVSLAVTVLGVIYGFYVLSDIVVKIKDGKIRLAEKDRDVTLINNNISDIQTNSEEIQKIISTLPEEYYEVSYFTTEIERLAQNNNLSIQILIDKEQKEEKSGVNSVVYLIKFTGNYTQIREFLSQLSKLKYFTNIDNLKMVSLDGQINTEIKFRLFIQK